MTHKDLDLWKDSIKFVTYVYEVTKKFPKEELYNLVSQIRRAAISVPSNIAEGAGRNHKNEFIQFLYIASGSLSEIETQFIISTNLKYIDSNTFDNLSQKINKIRSEVFGLIKSLKKYYSS